MKKNVLILVDHLARAGAETVAVQIAVGLKNSNRYDPWLCATRSGGPLEDLLRKAGVEYLVLGRSRTYEIHKFSLLARTIRQKNVQVLHSHKMGSNLWGSVMGRLNKVPAVITHVHGQRHSASERAAGKLITSLSDRVIVVSEFEKTAFVGGKADIAAKVVTVYNGIDLSRTPRPDTTLVRQGLGLPANRRRFVGVVAGLRPEKDIHSFLRAAKAVSNTFDDVHFLIVGDGGEMNRLKDYAATLGISERCLFTGFRSDAFDLTSILDVGVLSSTREGLPLALLEYLALSKPVVATRVGGIPEAVEDGVNGFLVRAGDHEDMGRRIILLLQNRELAANMGQAGQRICREKFGLESMLSNIESIYDEVLSD
jgi:glycosyltransferase involved in cell wall biosynthesis